MTACAVCESTPSEVVQIGISSVGGPLGRIARRVLARSEGRVGCLVVGRVDLSVRPTPRPYATRLGPRPRSRRAGRSRPAAEGTNQRRRLPGFVTR
jgi:hypothetical protein